MLFIIFLPDIIMERFNGGSVYVKLWTVYSNQLANCLGQQLLWLACRQHTFELVLKATFKELFGDTFSPEETFFKFVYRTRGRWTGGRRLKTRVDVRSANHHRLDARSADLQFIVRLLQCFTHTVDLSV